MFSTVDQAVALVEAHAVTMVILQVIALVAPQVVVLVLEQVASLLGKIQVMSLEVAQGVASVVVVGMVAFDTHLVINMVSVQVYPS